MKITREEIVPAEGSSFKLLLTPGLNDYFYWHFHPEYEIVYVEGASGTRHVGDHISSYENSDLVFIGPNIPHLNFDYGVRTNCEQVVVQMKENFLGKDFLDLPELTGIKQLFQQAGYGLSFTGETKRAAGDMLKQLNALNHFDQLILLLQIFKLLASSKEVSILNTRLATNKSYKKEQHRLESVYHFIESHYQHDIDVNVVSKQANLTTAAFCRFFKKNTKMTFTDFVNQYRINQAKNLLLQHKTVSEACYATGFGNASHFNKVFKKIAGENPSDFRKRYIQN